MSAADSIEEMLHSEVTCYLCVHYFINPVTLDCGHSFCHSCILRSWGPFSLARTCPRCQKAILRTNLRPNDQLANVARLIRQLKDVAKQVATGMRICEEHEDDATAFCMDDLVTFCLKCAEARDHQQHDVVSVEEAARTYTDSFISRVRHLRKQEEEIVKHEKEQQIGAEKGKMVEEFSKVHQLLEEQSSLWASRVEEALEEIKLKRSEHMAELSKEHSIIKETIWELNWKCEQLPFDILQDIGSTLERCMKEMSVNRVAFPPGLRGDVWELQNFNAFLPGVVKQFEEALVSGYQQMKGFLFWNTLICTGAYGRKNADFGPDTDHPKRMKMRNAPQDSPEDSEENLTESTPCAWHTEEFTAGGH
uniref:Zinc finger protein RFP-like isoform X2 n=1 Tax=Pogona vitticeps TaxID=103695 RepID=A0ABM5FIC2_9SAUR